MSSHIMNALQSLKTRSLPPHSLPPHSHLPLTPSYSACVIATKGTILTENHPAVDVWVFDTRLNFTPLGTGKNITIFQTHADAFAPQPDTVTRGIIVDIANYNKDWVIFYVQGD